MIYHDIKEIVNNISCYKTEKISLSLVLALSLFPVKSITPYAIKNA